MPVRVLVVDDSALFRRRVCAILEAEPQIEVAGTARDGREAVRRALELKPDVITMDYAMPVMDGISAVREIMARAPTPVIMFSALTAEGASVTLDALAAGAADYLPKFRGRGGEADVEEDLARELCDKILTIAAGRGHFSAAAQAAAGLLGTEPVAPAGGVRRSAKRFELLTLGGSTGAPLALQGILRQLPADFPLPILVMVHMPAPITPCFVERLGDQCAIRVEEAATGVVPQGGTAYLVPGGCQVGLRGNGEPRFLVDEGDPGARYRPSLDIGFAEAARCYHGKVLAIVLTGMGSDGVEGARVLKEHGATVWAQDEASSVVYGIPMAVAGARLADEILNLAEIPRRILQEV